MKILALCGSPKKGNCYSVLNSIQERNPDIEMKIIMLGEVKLEQCKGCYVCVSRGEEHCPLKDDRDMIVQEMSEADGIILASPVHVNHISALMKHFIGRIGYLGHRPHFFDKQVMVMSIGGGFGADEANKYMSGIFSVFGMNVASLLELYISAPEERKNPVNIQKTNEAYRKLVNAIREGQGELPPPTLLKLIYFNIFKAISELNKKEGIADYEYYKDKTGYHYDTKINPLKKFLADRISKREITKMVKDR